MTSRIFTLTCFVCCTALMVDIASAQRPGGRGRGGPGGPEANPLMAALDTDQDGELSAEEIENAVAALKSIDANGDGKLAGNEIRPRRRGGFGGDPEQMVAGMLERFDENDDGKISKSEAPERMWNFLGRADENGDDILTKEELMTMAESRRGRGGRGARGGDRPERPRRPRVE